MTSTNVSKRRVMDIEKDPTEMGKNQKKQAFIVLRAQGFSYRDIEEKLGVSRTTLGDWASELEEEIASLKAIELEALYQEYYMTKEAKIEALGEVTNKLRDELVDRNLSDVDTDKLLEIYLRYSSKLEEEKVDVRPLSQIEVEKLADKSFTNPDAVREEIDLARLRYKVGLLDRDKFKEEIKALRAKLRAKDQEELEDKLDRLEAVLDRR